MRRSAVALVLAVLALVAPASAQPRLATKGWVAFSVNYRLDEAA